MQRQWMPSQRHVVKLPCGRSSDACDPSGPCIALNVQIHLEEDSAWTVFAVRCRHVEGLPQAFLHRSPAPSDIETDQSKTMLWR